MNKRIHCRTVLKSNRKIGRSQNDRNNRHTHGRVISWLDTDTSISGRGCKAVSKGLNQQF